MELGDKFSELNEKNEAAFMAHIYFGDPYEGFSMKLIDALLKNGVDILEFGIPFSDPTADGSSFIKACNRSLANNIKVKDCIKAISETRKNYSQPIVVTSYFNIVYQYGIFRFMADIRKAGAQGLIIPEAVVEESYELVEAGKANNISVIFLIGPNSSGSRIDMIGKAASGFVYLTSKSGVTGADKNKAGANSIEKIKKQINLPVLIGFGISGPAQVKALISEGADGIIIGSRIADIYSKYLTENKMKDEDGCLKEVSGFVKGIKDACKR